MAINVTIDSHKHLGAVLESRYFLEECVGEKVDKWVNEDTKLADFAISQPQACYAAFTFGLQYRWTYVTFHAKTSYNGFPFSNGIPFRTRLKAV